LSDVKLTHPERKFKPQDTVKCRVLVTNPSEKRVSVTLKKTLVNSNLPIVASLADAKEGLVTHAVITGMNRAGCFVTFYNGFSTFVPVGECSETFVNDVSEKFSIGQTIKCRVVSVDQEKKSLRVSFRTNVGSEKVHKDVDMDMGLSDTKAGEVFAVNLLVFSTIHCFGERRRLI